jgi:hypothetical protein
MFVSDRHRLPERWRSAMARGNHLQLRGIRISQPPRRTFTSKACSWPYSKPSDALHNSSMIKLIIPPHLLTAGFAVALLGAAPTACKAAGEIDPIKPLPLDAAQRQRLRHLVATDPEAAVLFDQIKEAALPQLSAAPRPLARIHYEGLLNTDPRRIQTVAHLRDLNDLAVVFQYWQVSEDREAVVYLRKHIMAWANTYVPTGNDVNEAKLIPVFVAYDALRPLFQEHDQRTVDAWVEKIADFHAKAVESPRSLSNRFTKSLWLLAIFSRTLGRSEWQEASVKGFHRFVAESLRPDGTSFDLEHRDSLGYHISALRPLISIAIVAGADGPSLYEWEAPSGASLQRSVAYIVPFASGEKQRPEWVNSKVKLDHERAAAGIEHYRKGRLFDPANARQILEEASYFDPSLHALALKLNGSTARRFASWTMASATACRREQLSEPQQ